VFEVADKLMKLVKFHSTVNHENRYPDFCPDPAGWLFKNGH
jgi:hypothetical protein